MRNLAIFLDGRWQDVRRFPGWKATGASTAANVIGKGLTGGRRRYADPVQGPYMTGPRVATIRFVDVGRSRRPQR